MNKKQIITTCCVVLLSVSGASAQQQLRISQAECREMALAHSEDLQRSENALRQAELDRKIAKTAFLPNVDASATGAYVLPDMDMMGMKLRMRGTYMAGINLTQPIYTGGKITTGHRLARIGEEAAAEQLRMTRMDVLVEADNAYWTYIAVGRKVRMLESYHAQMDTLYRQTAAALAAGMATENDLLRIDAKRSDIRYQLQKVQNGADLCRMSLCRIVDVNFDTQIEATDTAFVTSQPDRLSAETAADPNSTCSKSRSQPKRSRSCGSCRYAAYRRAVGRLLLLRQPQTQRYGRCRRRDDGSLLAEIPRRHGVGHAFGEDSDFPLGREPKKGTQGAV